MSANGHFAFGLNYFLHLENTAIRRFHKLTFSTLIAVYILIFVGGVVRSTGAGMGCPDWPRCFGQWIPPTSVEELPPDYKEKYAAFREKKNIKFAKYLSMLGFQDSADKILSDKSILKEADFNPIKTSIEYINRVVGVIIGFFIIVLAYRSWAFRFTDAAITWISISTLALVIFQGWFGSIVVSTNLTSWTVTIHMFLAIVMVFLLVVLWHVSGGAPRYKTEKGMVTLALAAMMMLLIQIFFGTEVREGIDRVSGSLPRSEWISGVGTDFILHRSFSWAVVLIHMILIAKLNKTVGRNALSLSLIILILGTFLTGSAMALFDFPAVFQPLHLMLAIMTVGAEMMVVLRLIPVSTKEIYTQA